MQRHELGFCHAILGDRALQLRLRRVDRFGGELERPEMHADAHARTEIAMGVRYGEPEWKARVEKLIADNRPKITAILRDYGVPLVDESGSPID